MKIPSQSSSCLITIFLFLFLIPTTLSVSDRPKSFVIHVAKSHKPKLFTSHRHWYTSILSSLPPSPADRPAKLLYTYEKAATGFSAAITAAQAERLRGVPGVVAVLPDEINQIQTTRTYSFLGLDDAPGNVWPEADYGEGVIIGVLDSGIWWDHACFNDSGLSPVPSRWKGECVAGDGFPASACNRKIIGAVAFKEGYGSNFELNETVTPLDLDGHGTHVAATAAGSVYPNAPLVGRQAGRESRGMAPKAMIAVYKVCWKFGCSDSDILAAMDRAISDGVDIISMSVASVKGAREYVNDSKAIAAFGATQHGVLFSAIAGNNGPWESTTVNVAPWILTTGASSIDREFRADVVLGNGRAYKGVSLYTQRARPGRNTSLIFGSHATGDNYCRLGRLLNDSVAGKIVVCKTGVASISERERAIRLAGGVGMITENIEEYGEHLMAISHRIPATMVSPSSAKEIEDYALGDEHPTASIIFRGALVGRNNTTPAPGVAAFSGRGPNKISPQILKPDIVAPGVNILAASTGGRTVYDIQAGTSMACPHVSGIAALLKKVHPEWSPAAIKSALMTTAYHSDNSGEIIKDLVTGKEATPFDLGAGHVDPARAVDPGLVYDLGLDDYITFLCASGYGDAMGLFLRNGSSSEVCSDQSLRGRPGDLNYPSFSVVFTPSDYTITYERSVTNVGSEADAVYEVSVVASEEVKVTVWPERLVFSAEEKTVSYKVTFQTRVYGLWNSKPRFGWIEWSDGYHRVRSPFACTWDFSSLIASA